MMDDIQARLEIEIGDSFLTCPKTYIGDGVYAFYDGFSVILATSRGCCDVHWIALEPSHIAALQQFLKEASL